MAKERGIRICLAVVGSFILIYGLAILIIGITATQSYDQYFDIYPAYIYIVLGCFSIVSGASTIWFVSKPSPGSMGMFTTYSLIALFAGIIHLIIFMVIYGTLYWPLIIGVLLQLIVIITGCQYPKTIFRIPNSQLPYQQPMYVNQVPGYPPQGQYQQGYFPQQQYIPPPQHMVNPQQGYYPQNGQYMAMGAQVPPDFQAQPPQVIQGEPIPPVGYNPEPQEPKQTKNTDQ